MTTDENIMAEMLDRATRDQNGSSPDQISVKMFRMVVCSHRHNPPMLQTALEMIVGKIRSTNETEALSAIAMLEECMSSCGTEFQEEVSKFRFLNMLISLVSVKYAGRETSLPIKQRIMDLLLLWTAEFPQRTKIREAYDSLKKESALDQSGAGVLISAISAAPKRENIFATDEVALAKLVKSTNQEDLMRANLLIQHRFKQEASRSELLQQQKTELQEARNTVALLDQMLEALQKESIRPKDDSKNETLSLIEELYIACKKHKPIVDRLPELVEKDEDRSDFVRSEALETQFLLQEVMQRYKNVMGNMKTKPVKPKRKTTNNLSTDLLGDVIIDAKTSDNEALVPAVAADVDTTTAPIASFAVGANAITLEELTEIFKQSTEVQTEQDAKLSLMTESADKLVATLPVLEPINVFELAATNTNNGTANGGNVIEKRSPRELREIDQLSKELFEQSLKTTERISTFKKEPVRVSINDLVKEKRIVKSATQPAVAVSPTKSKYINDTMTNNESKKTSTAKAKAAAILVNSDDDLNLLSTNDVEVVQAKVKVDTLPPFKHLSEITIDLDSVTPTEERLLLDDEDVRVTFSLTTNRPSTHVSVIVISLINKSKTALKDFHLEASVKKPSKVRLLPPSENALLPCKPFRPTVPINQVLLLHNPTGYSVDLTCIVGYKLGDDPDPIKESIVAKDIPFVE